MKIKQLVAVWRRRTKIKDTLEESDFKKLVYPNNKVRKQFKSLFNAEINNFIKEVFKAYQIHKLADEKCKDGDKQKSYAVGYLFNALDNLVTSFNLLIEGHLEAGGNLFRQFSESLAMAILISNKNLSYFERLMSEKNKFPFHKALKYVSSDINKLNIDSNAWEKFVKNRDFYHLYSHSSLLAMANRFNFYRVNTVVFGGNYDQAKVDIYRKEIGSRITAAKCLRNVCEGILPNL